MKLTLLFTLTFALLIAATPASGAKGTDTVAMVDCENCNNRFRFCFDNGRTKGEEGCAQTCAEHVVHQTAECRDCSDELKKAPKESRYRNACGDKPCF